MKVIAYFALIGFCAACFVMVLAGRWTPLPLVVGGWVLFGGWVVAQAGYRSRR